MTDPTGFAMIPRWLVESPDVSDRAKVLFAVLSGRIRRDGIRLTRAELATILGCSIATVKRTVKELREAGVITHEESDGDNDGALYGLAIDARGLDTPGSPVSPPPGHPRPSPRVTGDSPPSSIDVSRPLAPHGAATRLPEPFIIDDSMWAWARDNLDSRIFNVQAETEAFIDYWRGAAGAKARKLDWPATWRNWMRRANENAINRNRGPHLRAVPSGPSQWDRATFVGGPR